MCVFPFQEELSYLRHSSCVGESSIFNVCNLDPAVELLSKRAVVKNSEVEKPKEGILMVFLIIITVVF